MSAGVRYNAAFRTLGKALISLVSRIHAAGLSVKPQTCRTLVGLMMTWPRVRLLAEKNRISSRMIVLNSGGAIEHTFRKIAGVEFYNQTFSNCRPKLNALLAAMNTLPLCQCATRDGHLYVPMPILKALSPVAPNRVLAEGSAALWAMQIQGKNADGSPFTDSSMCNYSGKWQRGDQW
jgi:hypothetical protein